MNNNKLNKIEILNEFFTKDDNSPLRLFSLFISSNPDFKYNITYLTDQIESFNKASMELKKRFIKFGNTFDQIKKATPEGITGYLIFDNVFQYRINTDEEVTFAFINLDLFRFDKLDFDYYTAKFILGDKNYPKKIDTYKIYQKNVTDIESEIKKLWESFII